MWGRLIIFSIFSETSTIHAGLVVEVWSKNIILDRALGFQFIPLESLPYNQYDYPTGYEQWFNIDAEQIIVNGEVQGTTGNSTGHMLLMDLHFELPFGMISFEVFCASFLNFGLSILKMLKMIKYKTKLASMSSI